MPLKTSRICIRISKKRAAASRGSSKSPCRSSSTSILFYRIFRISEASSAIRGIYWLIRRYSLSEWAPSPASLPGRPESGSPWPTQRFRHCPRLRTGEKTKAPASCRIPSRPRNRLHAPLGLLHGKLSFHDLHLPGGSLEPIPADPGSPRRILCPSSMDL